MRQKKAKIHKGIGLLKLAPQPGRIWALGDHGKCLSIPVYFAVKRIAIFIDIQPSRAYSCLISKPVLIKKFILNYVYYYNRKEKFHDER